MPAAMSAAEALRQAESEGLTPRRSGNTNTGFLNVCFEKRGPKGRPYMAAGYNSEDTYDRLGNFATVEEAALCVARANAAHEANAAEQAAQLAKEAMEQARAEGLTLQQSDNLVGYRGVKVDSNWGSGKRKGQLAKRFKAIEGTTDAGAPKVLGYFSTAEEAALCYARSDTAKAARIREAARARAEAEAIEREAARARKVADAEARKKAEADLRAEKARAKAEEEYREKWVERLISIIKAANFPLIHETAEARERPQAAGFQLELMLGSIRTQAQMGLET